MPRYGEVQERRWLSMLNFCFNNDDDDDDDVHRRTDVSLARRAYHHHASPHSVYNHSSLPPLKRPAAVRQLWLLPSWVALRCFSACVASPLPPTPQPRLLACG